MREKKKAGHPRTANWVLMFGMVLLLAAFLTVVYRNDLKEISALADETLEFMKSVCQRYDSYAAGNLADRQKVVYDKTKVLAKFADIDWLHSPDQLLRYAKEEQLSGVLVTNPELEAVAQADINGENSGKLWRRLLERETVKDILAYPKKTFNGSVTVEDTTYQVCVMAREDGSGLVVGYADTALSSTDIYEALLDKTLTNNTFHRNPKLIITDGEEILATNATQLQDNSLIAESPFADMDEVDWSKKGILRLHWKGQTWYGRRMVYGTYFIFAFYPPAEVFTNMLPMVTTFIAVYALLCMGLMIVRKNSERRHLLRERHQLDTIQAITRLYVTSSILHIPEKRVEGITSTPRAQAVLDESDVADVVAKKLAERIIEPGSRGRYCAFLDFDTMEERLRGKVSLGEVFRDVNGIWFSTHLIPMSWDADGHLQDVLFVSRDINDYKQREERIQNELRRTARDAEVANMAKTSFLRRMSHDIRTPLNGIRGMAILAKDALQTPERVEECLQKIITSADYLQAIMNDIFQMSKLESGRFEFEERPFDLRQVLVDTGEFIEERAREKGVQFSMELQELVYTQVTGSPLHLRQVLQNILSNAVKFTPAGGNVYALCRERGVKDGTMQLEFICTDTGIGISPEFQTHIFEPFTQEDSSARSNYIGTGLGLPIVREILEQCGGSIQFTSEKNHGTTFTVQVPLKLDLSGPQMLSNEEISIEGVRILVVEDNELNMEIAHCVLEEKGAQITEACDGAEAVRIFSEAAPGSFDIILMDIMMPNMDGLEATRAIRALNRPDATKIPIFAMTANGFVEDIRKSRKAGMNEHLTKPLDMEQMAALIYQYCRMNSQGV